MLKKPVIMARLPVTTVLSASAFGEKSTRIGLVRHRTKGTKSSVQIAWTSSIPGPSSRRNIKQMAEEYPALTHGPSEQNTETLESPSPSKYNFPFSSGKQDTKQITAGYEGDVEILSTFQASLSDSTGTLILATTCYGSLRRQSPRKRKSAWRRYTSTVLRKRCGNNKRGEQTGKVHENVRKRAYQEIGRSISCSVPAHRPHQCSDRGGLAQ